MIVVDINLLYMFSWVTVAACIYAVPTVTISLNIPFK